MLAKLLQNVCQTKIAPFAVVVVDSSDSAWTRNDFSEMQARFPFQIHYLASKPGLPYQRNVGLAYVKEFFSKATIVHFLDDDVLIPEDYFATIEALFCQFQDIVALGAYDSNHIQPKQSVLRRLLLVGSLNSQGSILKSGIAIAPSNPSKLTYVAWLPGFGISVRLGILNKANPIWDGQYRMYGEDVDACLKLQKFGLLAVHPSVHLRHFEATAQRDQLEVRQYQSDAFRLRLAKEHPDLVKRQALIYSTIALAASECFMFLMLKGTGHIYSAKGHFRFLVDFVSKRVSPQLVSHDSGDLSPILIFR